MPECAALSVARCCINSLFNFLDTCMFTGGELDWSQSRLMLELVAGKMVHTNLNGGWARRGGSGVARMSSLQIVCPSPWGHRGAISVTSTAHASPTLRQSRRARGSWGGVKLVAMTLLCERVCRGGSGKGRSLAGHGGPLPEHRVNLRHLHTWHAWSVQLLHTPLLHPGVQSPTLLPRSAHLPHLALLHRRPVGCLATKTCVRPITP